MKKFFAGTDFPLGATNIFDFQNPESFVCQVEQYRVSHKTLIIRVQAALSDQFYLVFSPVSYFEGPTAWQGANFYVGSSAEYLNLIYRAQSLNQVSDERLQQVSAASSSTLGRLFKVDTPNLRVRFTASEVVLTDDIAEMTDLSVKE
ncbi:MAG TPA: hypothetical protein VHO69_16035 [Phototrophicaceae bacterium]|nr:hypothetical protein [Phototrophicaceae bacterium]